MAEKSLQEIVVEIKNNVTGDPEHDKEYIMSQLVRYQGHPNFQEISRVLAKLLVRSMPKEGFKDVKNKLDDQIDVWRSQLQGAKKDMNAGRLEEALMSVEALVENADEMTKDRFKNDAVNKYFTFNNPFEEALYSVSHGEEITVRSLRIPIAETYFLHGYLLIELERYEEAKEALRKAIRWNPTYTDAQLEYAECLRVLGDLEGMKKFMTSALNLAYKPENIARAYRGLGYYFIEKEEWAAGAACEYKSMEYVDNPNARSEIGYINDITGKRYERPSREEFQRLCTRYGIPGGASNLVLGVAYSMAQQCEKAGSTEGANYFYGIYYSIAKDNEIRDKLEGKK